MERTLAISSMLVALVILALCSTVAWQQVGLLTIPFDTDESDHANAGIEVYSAVKSGESRAVTQSLTRQGFYPPINSIALATSYLALGPSYASSRWPSVIFYILTALLLGILTYNCACALDITPNFARSAAAISIFLFATSDIATRNSALCMLEPLATLLAALVFLFLQKRKAGALFALGLALLLMAVTLTKYSFGILLLPGIFLGLALPTNGQSLSRNARELALCLAIFFGLLGLWLIVTDREAAWHFLVGHPSNAPMFSAENLLYEVRAYLNEYCISTPVAALTLLCALLGTLTFWRKSELVRVSTCSIFASLGILLLSTTNEPRHFMVAIPPIFLLASLGAVTLIEKQRTRISQIALMLFLAVIFLTPFPKFLDTRAGAIRQELEGRPGWAELQTQIIKSHPPGEALLIIGATDDFSLEALRWLEAKSYGLPYTATKIDSFPFDQKRDFRDLRRKRNRSILALSPFRDSSVEEVITRGPYKSVALIRSIGARNQSYEIFKRALAAVEAKITFRKTADDKEIILAKIRE